MEYSENAKMRRARKRVEDLKGFYGHVLVYSIVNFVLFLVRGNVLDYYQNNNPDKNFVEWIDWNILIVPVLWGIGLLFHAAKVYQYKFRFIRKWEERQIDKILKKEESTPFKK